MSTSSSRRQCRRIAILLPSPLWVGLLFVAKGASFSFTLPTATTSLLSCNHHLSSLSSSSSQSCPKFATFVSSPRYIAASTLPTRRSRTTTTSMLYNNEDASVSPIPTSSSSSSSLAKYHHHQEQSQHHTSSSTSSLHMVPPAAAAPAVAPFVGLIHLFTNIQPSVMKAATSAVAKLVASCGLGYGMSKRGILDQAALSALSKLIFFVFQPALLFTNVATTLALSTSSLKKVLVLPVFACLQILFGRLLAMGVERSLGFKPSSPEGRELQMCTAFGNSGPLPLLFVDSIFGRHSDVTLLPTAVAYISFYLLGWSPMFWTAGYSILAGKPIPTKPMTDADRERFKKFGPLQKVVVRAQEIRASPVFKRVVSPPVMGCLAGFIAGATPFLRSLLVKPSAPLAPLFDAIKCLGAAYLPAAILVLAGSLARPMERPKGSSNKAQNNNFMRKVVAVTVARFILMPLTAAALLMGGSRMGVIPYDKLLWFVLLMEGCMPSAQNSVVILQMENKPELASSMARTLSAVYLVSAIPLAFLLSAILQFVRL